VGIINEEIDTSNFGIRKTFDQLSPENHEAILEGLRGSQELLLSLGRPLIDDITFLLSIKK